MKLKIASTFLSMFFVVAGVISQTPLGASVTGEERAAANDAYQKQDWKTAAARYEAIVKAEDKNAGARYRYGMALLNLDRATDAQTQFESAMAISPNAVIALGAARSYARIGNSLKVYETFERSLTLGGISAESLTAEKDFSSINKESKFTEYVKKLDAAANPCRSRPEHRQFDFWIGEWAPQNVQGVTVGTSSIQLILKSCIIFENWTTPVSAGKSFNVYDTRDGKWHQTWVDDRGLITHYTGGLVDGKMVLDSESVVNGKKTIARMTYSKLPEEMFGSTVKARPMKGRHGRRLLISSMCV